VKQLDAAKHAYLGTEKTFLLVTLNIFLPLTLFSHLQITSVEQLSTEASDNHTIYIKDMLLLLTVSIFLIMNNIQKVSFPRS